MSMCTVKSLKAIILIMSSTEITHYCTVKHLGGSIGHNYAAVLGINRLKCFFFHVTKYYSKFLSRFYLMRFPLLAKAPPYEIKISILN